jgi:argininosuccinate lyase
MKLWGGRFAESSDGRVADFSRSIEIDSALALDDLTGSIAHVHGLGRAGLLTETEVAELVAGLDGLRTEVEAGTLAWDPSLEDVHLNLEAALTTRIGPVAGKLHTGRSRNDQVSTDLRLWLRRTIDALDGQVLAFERALLGLAVRDGDAVLPGTTHIQPAQPVLFAHHLLAYVEMLERDRGRLADCRRRANVSPLGAGALAGAGYPLDREATARELGFDGVTANSLDAVSDRDFVVEFVSAVALTMIHLSRFAEELTWWSNPRFGFVRLADAFSTGSSMMPNKKNPDPAELVRGRAARVIGALAGLLALLKGLPLAYQRDLQEDKLPLFESAATLEASLGIMAGIVDSLAVDRDRMRAAADEGFITATAVADGLVRRGVPFRSAHHVVGVLVAAAERQGIGLAELTDQDIREALTISGEPTAVQLASEPGIGDAVRISAGIDSALASCDVVGGTAPERVAAALVAVGARLDADPNGAIQRHGQVIGLDPLGIAQYEAHHRAVPPPVLARIADCNIRNYSIFRQGDRLFAYFDYVGTDYPADMARMGRDPEVRAWWALVGPLQRPFPDQADGAWWMDLPEIFHSD